jgi:hypothetical protein
LARSGNERSLTSEIEHVLYPVVRNLESVVAACPFSRGPLCHVDGLGVINVAS